MNRFYPEKPEMMLSVVRKTEKPKFIRGNKIEWRFQKLLYHPNSSAMI